MKAVSIIAQLLPLGLPALAILWLSRTRAKSRAYFWSVFAFAAALLVASVGSYGYWFAVGMYWPLILVAAFALAAVVGVRKRQPARWLPKVWSAELFLTPLALILTLLAGFALPFVATAKAYEGEALELAYPLRGGTFVVLAGGANWSVNQHAYLGAPAGRYALDIGGLNRLGMRGSGLSPSALEDYAAFGAQVVAPCSGDVTAVENASPDRPPLSPSADPDDILGNYVVIFCQGHSVTLGHMQQGTVAVSADDRVLVGDPIGLVGNSGGTLEPHLHIQAVRGPRGADADALRSAPPVPIRLHGRFLIKHEWFRA